jgi:hypothetical protein
MHRHRVQRLTPLGRDRQHALYYFLDGLGGADAAVGTGKLFMWSDRTDARAGSWGYYATPEEVDALLASLDERGVREFALKTALTESYDRITAAMRRRQKVRRWPLGLPAEHGLARSLTWHLSAGRQELALALRSEDTRRSTRMVTASKRQPFMQYVNKWAR